MDNNFQEFLKILEKISQEKDNPVTCESCSVSLGNDEEQYHCEKCDGFVLCSSCFINYKVAKNHEITHPMSVHYQGQTVSHRCDSCSLSINGERYRCTVCKQFDLCTSCYNRSKWPSQHLGTHRIVSFYDLLDRELTMVCPLSFNCDVCRDGITGIRYHCNNCMNFDLCHSCYSAKKTIKPHVYTHVISAFKEPGSFPVPHLSTSHLVGSSVGVNPSVHLERLSSSHSQYNYVKNLFLSTWAKDLELKKTLSIRAICIVRNDALDGFYGIYRNILQKKGYPSNEENLWHGTGLICDLLQKSETCSSSSCPTCNIITNNFCLSRAQSNISFGRFGNGIYFSPKSSKSNDYNKGSERNGVRSLMLCKVQLGKSYRTQTNMTHLRGPPDECTSVFGEVGVHLNYPEVVVWDERAILPSYIVFYSGFQKDEN